MSRGFWILMAVTLVVYGVIMLWSLSIVSEEAGGLVPFDLRPGGYSLEEAQAFLAALSPEGLAQYEGPQRWLDMVYPALLAATLGWVAWRLSKGLPEWVGLVLMLLIGVGMSFDYLENLHVARMLGAGAEAVPAALVEAASRASVNKALTTTVAMFGILGLVIRNWRAKRRQ